LVGHPLPHWRKKRDDRKDHHHILSTVDS